VLTSPRRSTGLLRRTSGRLPSSLCVVCSGHGAQQKKATKAGDGGAGGGPSTKVEAEPREQRAKLAAIEPSPTPLRVPCASCKKQKSGKCGTATAAPRCLARPGKTARGVGASAPPAEGRWAFSVMLTRVLAPSLSGLVRYRLLTQLQEGFSRTPTPPTQYRILAASTAPQASHGPSV
jgi:hypothetical protein